MRTQGVVKQNDVVVVHFEKRRITEDSAFEESTNSFSKRRLPHSRFLIQVFPRDVGQMPR